MTVSILHAFDNPAAAIWPQTGEVSVSNIGSETGYRDFVVFLSSSSECRDSVSN